MDGRCMPNTPWPKILQEMMNITNHVALKYHIEFGAAKWKVVRIGKSKKSAIKLDGQTLEVDTYKYLGEVINTKNNTEARTEAIEAKNHAATQNIITETGNKEFKGLKMQAIWQLFDATITPIMTYGSEGWTLNKKKEENQLQTIHNKAIKTILALPQGTPTNILLAETGQLPLKYTMNKKKIMQAHRMVRKKDTLVKRITNNEGGSWKKMVMDIMEEYHLEENTYKWQRTCWRKSLTT